MNDKTSKQFKLQNFYDKKEVQAFERKKFNPNYKHHEVNIPFRMLVIGASGGGKTVCLCNILNHFTNSFNKIYLFVANLDEQLYDYVRSKLDKDCLSCHEGLDDLNDMNIDKDFQNDGQTLIIFDDLVLEKDQSKIAKLFIRGRKLANGISLCYLSQSYYQIPIMIRKQTNYIILRKIESPKDLSNMIGDISTGLTTKEFNQLYEKATENSLCNFLMIDKNKPGLEKFKFGFKTPAFSQMGNKTDNKLEEKEEKIIKKGSGHNKNKIQCNCGAIISKNAISKHIYSKKHLKDLMKKMQ